MESSLHIAHITDLHIAPDNSLVRDIDVRRNFLRMLDSVKDFQVNLLVLGGDLAAESGEIEAYQWIKAQLAKINTPYLIVPGNHDDISNLRKVFQPDYLNNEYWDFTWQSKDLLLMGIDSSKGVLTDQQLHWIHKTSKSTEYPILIFTHYPPLECGCSFMDAKYPLANRKDVFNIIAGCSNISAIFCGHYHTEKTVINQEKIVFLTPSTIMQMSQTNPAYEIESLRPGWRWIEYSQTGLSTRVIYSD